MDFPEQQASHELAWRQVSRGDKFRCRTKLTEPDARRRFLILVVASLGALCKDKANGVNPSRVPLDGPHRITVNRRFRIGDQERAPIAADLTAGPANFRA